MKLILITCLLIHSIRAVEWIPGRGAKLNFVEVEAEHANHNGEVIGSDRHYNQLASEASGRRAVTLNSVGQYVEFTTPIESNSIVVRYSIPDTDQGKDVEVRNASLDIYVADRRIKRIFFTTAYSHYYGEYPFNNYPGNGNHHHFYDENRTMFQETYPAGTKVKLQVYSVSESPSFTIDVADFELIPVPIRKPEGSVSVLDFGADPTGWYDSLKAFYGAVDAAKQGNRVVYVPEGIYQIYGRVILDEVEIRGAGPWYTILTGRDPNDHSRSVGLYGNRASEGGSRNVVIRDLAILGDTRERQDELEIGGIGGALSNSVIDNVWIQHCKCGIWVDGPMNNLTITNSRITDTNADGVNFHIGVTNSKVENCFLRNTGDDSLAMWGQDVVNANNKFVHNTLGLPALANSIAIYGGRDMEISDNFIYDTIFNGGGIYIANRFPGVNGDTAVSGTHNLFRNTLLRAGSSDYWMTSGIGAFWFSGENEPLTKATIHIKDTDVIDSSYAAIQYINGVVEGVVFENVFINGTGTFVLMLQSDSSSTFNNVKAINVRAPNGNPIHSCGARMDLNQIGDNSGWYTDQPFCNDEHGEWPEPQWPWTW